MSKMGPYCIFVHLHWNWFLRFIYVYHQILEKISFCNSKFGQGRKFETLDYFETVMESWANLVWLKISLMLKNIINSEVALYCYQRYYNSKLNRYSWKVWIWDGCSNIPSGTSLLLIRTIWFDWKWCQILKETIWIPSLPRNTASGLSCVILFSVNNDNVDSFNAMLM